MRLVDATPLECQAKERKENEWNQRVSPTSWAHAEESFLHRIEDAPTVDAVVVTRCKDCAHSTLPSELTRRYGKPGKLTCHNMHAPSNRRNVGSNDFCSYGERKDGES